jgi:hypothetical protein
MVVAINAIDCMLIDCNEALIVHNRILNSALVHPTQCINAFKIINQWPTP